MGCGGSSESPNREHGKKKRRSSVCAKPVVQLEIGENVQLNNSQPKLIFVFGKLIKSRCKMRTNDI
jgi:hypothetical protein